ncbi:MAG: lysophospholipid acyltransferase family protein [Cyclobacteriaceae bacterium]|nr:lysophospholipid acyltransferase family protein [Cyclobacteriaceae bacterium]
MFLLKLLSRLPLTFLYVISDLMFIVGYYIIRYRRTIVQSNLRNSFPEKTEKQIAGIEKEFYRNLCDYPIETLKLLTMSKDQVRKRIKYKNPEVIEKFAEKGQAMIYLTAHQFNWEWMLAGVCLQTSPQVYYVYQQQSSQFFDNFSNIIRQRFGALPIKREKVGREALKKKGTLHGLALLADQFPGLSHDKRYWTNFLHQDTAFFQGINQLAIITQYPVIFFVSRKVKRGYYEGELIQIAEPPYAKDDLVIVENYIKATEKIIREQPEGWLWSHDRWKKTRKEMGEE